MTQPTPPTAPRTPPRLAHAWMQISPSLIPILAVVTAFLFGIPLIMLTEASISKGWQTAGVAYSALVEGVTGLVVNDVASMDNFDNLAQYANTTEISVDGLTRQARPIERVGTIGIDNLNTFEQILAKYPDITDEDIELIGVSLHKMREVGAERIRATGALIQQLDADGISRADVKKLTTLVARKTSLNEEELAESQALWTGMNGLEGEALTKTLDYLNLMNTYTAQFMTDFATVEAQFDTLGIDLYSSDASALRDIFTLSEENPKRVREAIDTLKTLTQANVNDPIALGQELRLIGSLYSDGLLTSTTVNDAFNTGELKTLLETDLIIRRSDSIIVGKGMQNQAIGVLYDIQNNPVWYARLGGSSLMFFTARLESSLVKSIPYIIVGVAVGLGFISGVFNIGAEGQLRMGAITSVWLGIALVGLPPFLHITAVLLGGLLGGLLWGSIPGLLKAYTGASEVVITIMLNYIAALFIDYLIKADPKILGNADNTKTPPIAGSAHLPTMGDIPVWLLIGAGVAVFAWIIWTTQKNRDTRTLLRAVIYGVATILVGLFLQSINVTNRLHIGFLMMLVVVFGVDWFLQRTTAGFELRTVGINQSAARYAGMNVKLNVVLAMGLSGLLAGFAGAIEISGATFEMSPSSFLGFGFDSISVALLARKNPRYMILSGFLWGGLISAANLMQNNTGISIDLVRIIQALIIMFVAADQIIRFVYRIPKNTDESNLIFSAK